MSTPPNFFVSSTFLLHQYPQPIPLQQAKVRPARFKKYMASNSNKYRKAMRAAEKYVAAVQACIDRERCLEESVAAVAGNAREVMEPAPMQPLAVLMNNNVLYVQ